MSEPSRADPVVLLPGMIAGELMWGETPRLLREAGREVVLFKEAIGVLTSSISGMTDIAVATLDREAPGRNVIVGASLGAAVALEFAARHPERVSMLVLSGAPTGVGAAQLDIASFGKFTRSVADAAAERLFYDRRRLPEHLFQDSFRTFRDRRQLLNMARLMRASERFDSGTLLKAVEIDTLMIWGEHDRISRCDDWKRLVPLARRGTFVVVPECGHLPLIEQPDAFNRALLSFLASPARQSQAR